MQLILHTDSHIDIPRNMSVIEQESLSLDGKFTNHDVKDKVKNDILKLMEDVKDNELEDCQDNDDSTADNVKKINRNSEDKSDDVIEKENSSDNEKYQKDSNSIEAVSEVEELNVTENNISCSVENKDDNEHSSSSEQLKDSNILPDDVNDEDEDHSEKKVARKDLENHNDQDKEVMNEPIELNLQDISQSDEKSIERDETSICKENNTENEDQEKVDSASSDIIACEGNDIEMKENNDEHTQGMNEKSEIEKECNIEKQIANANEICEINKQDIVKSEFMMRIKNVSEINEENFLETESDKRENEHEATDLLDKANNEELTDVRNVSLENERQSKTKGESGDLEKKEVELNKESNKCIENEEIIDIADEKDEECITVIDQDMRDVDKEPEEILNLEDNLVSSENKKSKAEIKCNDQENVNLKSKENSANPDLSKEIKVNENLEVPLVEDVSNNQSIKQVSTQSIKEKKPLLHISKLSNTLDILSDDEEEPAKEESQVQSTAQKQCINIEDDDDIMLIDEEISKDAIRDDITVPTGTDAKKNEKMKEQCPEDSKEDVSMDVTNNDQDGEPESILKDVEVTETEIKDDKLDNTTEEKPSTDSTLSSKPLLPVNFLKSCKKNLAEMTREELEEFCVLKIVESVVDRSNLSEMNLQLKSMAHNIEDYKKKTNTLMKQNRDLQVVLKSVQEEQKKNSGQPITPLKITRSVGMQVLMMETPSRKKPMAPNKFQNSLSLNSVKSAKCQSPKTNPKSQNQNSQQYPVPRLVPAVNNTNTNNKPPTPTPIAPKTQNNLPNGIKNPSPIPKPEKRSFGKMQQGNSITVDLTDDEPPSKVVQRNIAAPVRLVPQQSLLTPQRPQFANSANTPRKVYIPISGSQNQVGQAIVLKQLNPHVPRLRGPTLLPKPSTSVRMPRMTARHPAPLPDSIKQYQPPNWKALPPAPELKLSKVENGIVISWKIDGYQEDNHEEIASYQLYAYQETTSPPSTALWKKIGDVKALPLPMACTLTQFMAGYKYYFAVRAVDVRSRLGPFSLPGSILLLNKM